MELTPTQASTVKAITSVFETGKPEGDYSAVAILDDGAGISYGRHQATDRSGTLDLIVEAYVRSEGHYAKEIAQYVARLRADESVAAATPPPLWLKQLMWLLYQAGNDPAMREAQDSVFDSQYFVPATELCDSLKLKLPLSAACVYDCCIQSGFGGVSRIRKRFAELPPSKGGDEREWVKAFTYSRHVWLSWHRSKAVRTSAYRTDALLFLIKNSNWELDLPIIVLGRQIGQ